MLILYVRQLNCKILPLLTPTLPIEPLTALRCMFKFCFFLFAYMNNPDSLSYHIYPCDIYHIIIIILTIHHLNNIAHPILSLYNRRTVSIQWHMGYCFVHHISHLIPLVICSYASILWVENESTRTSFSGR